jgi:hypothetical protein
MENPGACLKYLLKELHAQLLTGRDHLLVEYGQSTPFAPSHLQSSICHL